MDDHWYGKDRSLAHCDVKSCIEGGSAVSVTVALDPSIWIASAARVGEQGQEKSSISDALTVIRAKQ